MQRPAWLSRRARKMLRTSQNPPAYIHVSKDVMQGLILSKVNPKYPDEARKARIQGTVLLTAVISKSGDIKYVDFVSGPPMLITPSMDAVQQWKYKPFLLNGKPVEVVTKIEVNYKLGRLGCRVPQVSPLLRDLGAIQWHIARRSLTTVRLECIRRTGFSRAARLPANPESLSFRAQREICFPWETGERQIPRRCASRNDNFESLSTVLRHGRRCDLTQAAAHFSSAPETCSRARSRPTQLFLRLSIRDAPE